MQHWHWSTRPNIAATSERVTNFPDGGGGGFGGCVGWFGGFYANHLDIDVPPRFKYDDKRQQASILTPNTPMFFTHRPVVQRPNVYNVFRPNVQVCK